MEPKPTLFNRIKTWIKNHKFWTIAIIIVLALAIYGIVKASAKTASTTTYVIGTVSQDTVVSTVTGTGQVSSSNQFAVPAKASGTLTSLRVQAGDSVRAGQVIASIDDTSAAISLKQAQNSLAKAKQSLQNDQTTQALSLTNQQISLNSTTLAQPKQNNQDAVTPSVSGSYNSTEKGTYTISNYSCSGGTCISYEGIESGFGLISSNIPIKLGTRGLYLTFSSVPKIPDTWTVDVPSQLASGYLSQTQNLETSQQNNAITIANDQQAIADTEINLQSAQLAYNNTLVTAPVAGIIGTVSVVKGQNVSSGTAIVTLVGNQQYADIPFNEVDVAKIKVGDTANATFDAVDDLTITGKVISIDQIGTVTSGVVNYTVKIGFDVQDARVKSGMSTTIVVATNVAQNATVVPASAVKTSGNGSYVLTVSNDTAVSSGNTGIEFATPPTQTPVTVGISDDTNTQILSGLSVGDKIVTKTITTSATTATASSAPSLLGGSASRSGAAGGGATRALGR
ncbi:MAG: family efflux transporter subunit, HlyD family secretion protein [Patescibacteria group bacterium]|nr:family efflux transporter subunit, HlyD family secretion protein [Patescibacteria group bacterium]